MTDARRRYSATAEEFSERVAIPLMWILARGGRKGLSLQEIKRLAVVSGATAVRRLNELRERGLITRTDRGKWVSLVVMVPVLPLVAQEPVGTLQETVEALEPTPPPENVPERRISDRAQRLANKMSVPPTLDGKEVELSPPRKCVECGQLSVLKYGVASVCPKCARAWGGCVGGGVVINQGDNDGK